MAKSFSCKALLPQPHLLTVRGVDQVESGWVVRVDGPDQGDCPACARVSRSRHSRYVRTLKDLPALGAAVSLKVTVSRWRCRNPECAVRFFAGALAGVADVRGRRTCRVDLVTRLVGQALGGLPGQRLIGEIGVPVSDDTILRQLKKCARSVPVRAQVVGVDEWAKRKGLSYGTIVVDLERRAVVDLLDSHSTEAIEKWLVAHPEIHTICRDRNGRYAKAARQGGPKAEQVADRFHLVQNLRDAIQRELLKRRSHLRVEVPRREMGEIAEAPSHTAAANARRGGSERAATDEEIQRQSVLNKQELFQQVKTLQASGLKISAIARRLGYNRRRFDRWAKVSELPPRNRMQPRPGSIGTFVEYLRQRWEQGHQNGRRLFKEIQAMGYSGGYTTLARALTLWRHPTVQPESPAPGAAPVTTEERKEELRVEPNEEPGPRQVSSPTMRQISPQVAATLLAKPRPQLTDRQRETVDALKRGCPEFGVMRKLMMGFRSILRRVRENSDRKKRLSTFRAWMKRARATAIPSIKQFVVRLQRDMLAVQAAITEPWSNGPVEGQVNRLKTIKRQMYGRAGVELLRARLVPLPVLQRK